MANCPRTEGIEPNFCINDGDIQTTYGIGEERTGRSTASAEVQNLIAKQNELSKQFRLCLNYIHCEVYGSEAWQEAGLPPGEFNPIFDHQIVETTEDKIACTRSGIRIVEDKYMAKERASAWKPWKTQVAQSQGFADGAAISTDYDARDTTATGGSPRWIRRVYNSIIDAFLENEARMKADKIFYYAQYHERDQVTEMANMSVGDVHAIDQGLIGTVRSYSPIEAEAGRQVSESPIRTCLLQAICGEGETVYDWALQKYQDYLALRVYQAMAKEDSALSDLEGGDIFEPDVGYDSDQTKEQAEAETKALREVAKALARNALAAIAGLAAETELAGYREQCFLLSQLPGFVAHRWGPIARSEHKPLPYIANDDAKLLPKNASIQLVGDTFGMLNKLTQYPTQLALFKARPHMISSLQPMIRLFKLSEDDEGNEIEQEFNFEGGHGSMWSTDFLNNKDVRGYGVGIKDFNFTYDGNNPFAVKKSIKATLKIFANNFDELLRPRNRPEEVPYRYIDLALKTGGNSRTDIDDPCVAEAQTTTSSPGSQEASEELDKLNFRLKAVVGWALPPDAGEAGFWDFQDMGIPGTWSGAYGASGEEQIKELKKAISDSYVTLNLTPTIHDFKFDEMGRVTFTIDYLAYIEDFFDQNTFNIFSDVEISGRILSREMKFKKLAKDCRADKIAELKEKEQSNIKADKIASLATLMSRLIKKGQIRFLNISYDKLLEWQQRGPYTVIQSNASIQTMPGNEGDELIAKIKEAATAATAEVTTSAWNQHEIANTLNTVESDTVSFFYVFNLVDSILEGIDGYLKEMPTKIENMAGDACARHTEKQKLIKFYNHFKKFRAVLGPIEIISPTNPGNKTIVSIGDLPISVRFFTDWLTEQLLSKEEAVYPLPMFLNDFFNVLVRNFMNDDTCFKTPIKQRIRVTQASLTDYKNSTADDAPDTLTKHLLSTTPEGKKDWPLIISNPPGDVQMLPRQGNEAYSMSYPILNISGRDGDLDGEAPLEAETNYLIYSAGRTAPSEQMEGDVVKDWEHGIMHYIMGENVGIVKKIDLKKTSSPGLKEVRFEQDGYDGLRQLREVYDAEITTFADVGAFPGKYIFVDPRGFAPQTAGVGEQGKMDLTEFGIGGYFMIIRSTHSFARGVSETQLTAKWVAERSGKPRDESQEAPEGDQQYQINRPSPRKCGWQHPGHNDGIWGGGSARTISREPSAQLIQDTVGEPTYRPPVSATQRAAERRSAQLEEDLQGGGLCFIAGTMVTMYDGTTKPIETVTTGDKVLSYRGGKKVPGIVTTPLVHDVGYEYEVAIIGKVVGDGSHPIFYGGEWISLIDHPEASLSKMYVENLYNLEVDGHTIHGSEHNFVIENHIMSGLGDGEKLNSVFRRDVAWKAKGTKTAPGGNTSPVYPASTHRV